MKAKHSWYTSLGMMKTPPSITQHSQECLRCDILCNTHLDCSRLQNTSHVVQEDISLADDRCCSLFCRFTGMMLRNQTKPNKTLFKRTSWCTAALQNMQSCSHFKSPRGLSSTERSYKYGTMLHYALSCLCSELQVRCAVCRSCKCTPSGGAPPWSLPVWGKCN